MRPAAHGENRRPPGPGWIECAPTRRCLVPKAKKTSRGGSKRGKLKPGKNKKGQPRKGMKRLSVRKDQQRD
jgi:hypothetical protein